MKTVEPNYKVVVLSRGFKINNLCAFPKVANHLLFHAKLRSKIRAIAIDSKILESHRKPIVGLSKTKLGYALHVVAYVFVLLSVLVFSLNSKQRITILFFSTLIHYCQYVVGTLRIVLFVANIIDANLLHAVVEIFRYFVSHIP
mgnify:CR=1 FL=1